MPRIKIILQVDQNIENWEIDNIREGLDQANYHGYVVEFKVDEKLAKKLGRENQRWGQ